MPPATSSRPWRSRASGEGVAGWGRGGAGGDAGGGDGAFGGKGDWIDSGSPGSESAAKGSPGMARGAQSITIVRVFAGRAGASGSAARALIGEAAIRSHCNALFSEDCGHGPQLADLEVLNPLRG